jgi:predicted ATP-grasp superfamily ATP-dependent carboligase
MSRIFTTPPSTDQLNLLAIGLDVASLVTSIRRAGHNAYAIDYFGDIDVQQLCKESFSIVTQNDRESCGRIETDFSPEKLIPLFQKMIKRHRIDGVLLTSGLEDTPDVLSLINEQVPFLGNIPHAIQKVRQKESFFQTLKYLRIPHPETEIITDLQDAKKTAKDIGYPIIVKPEHGFGGVGVRKISDPKQLTSLFKTSYPLSQRFVIQEFIPGQAASASVISTGEKVVTLTVNEQLLGMSSLGQREEFGYCGNIVPLASSNELREQCCAVAEQVISTYELVGSNGVDFVISDQGLPNVIEVNPRFQGTLECVEQILGINIVQTHLDACIMGVVPDITLIPEMYCTRLILYALQRSIIPNLQIHQGIRDIPFPGVIVEDGEPLCSVIMNGVSRESSLTRAKSVAHTIFQSLNPKISESDASLRLSEKKTS